MTGPALLLQITDGTEVGRFFLALVANRLFPLLGHEFIDRVREEHLIADASFNAEPYADDRLDYLSDRLAEYTTPANHSGLGTDSLLEPADLPIHGLTMLNPEAISDALTEFRIRLPAAMAPVENAPSSIWKPKCLQLRQGCRGWTTDRTGSPSLAIARGGTSAAGDRPAYQPCCVLPVLRAMQRQYLRCVHLPTASPRAVSKQRWKAA